jgi:hypothetical protein
MTFGGPHRSSSLALATAFEEGAEDPATHPLVQKTRASFVDTLGSIGNDFVVGTPLWKPHGTLLWDIAANQFGAAPQLLFQAASGCLAKSDTDCGAAIKTLIGEQNPLDELQEASKHDLISQSGEAATGTTRPSKYLPHFRSCRMHTVRPLSGRRCPNSQDLSRSGSWACKANWVGT